MIIFGIVRYMQKVEISSKTIIFTVAFILTLYFLWVVQNLLYSLFIGFILMSALRPLVSALKRKRVPHTVAVTFVYVGFVLFFLFLFGIIIPPIILETVNLLRTLPYMIQSISPDLQQWVQIESLSQYVPNVTNQIFSIAGNIFSNIIFVLSTLFFGYYLLLEEQVIKRFFSQLFDEKKAEWYVSILEKAERRMSNWFWGELMLMTVVGWLTFIGLSLLQIRYAVPLAVLAGLLEMVPNVGPMMSAVPSFIIGLSISPFAGFSTLALYFIVQQLENNLIVPVIMKRAVGINPIVTLIALIVGGQLGGVLGLIVAIPIYVFAETFAKELLKGHQVSEILR